MERPEVKKGEWITVKKHKENPGFEARIFRVEDDGTLFVGYHEDSIQTTKATAAWNETFWKINMKKPLINSGRV